MCWCTIARVITNKANSLQHFYTTPYKYMGGVYWNHFVCLSVRLSFCPCIRVCLDDISWTTEPFLTKLGMMVYYHMAVCRAEIFVHYLQCQGHSEGLYNQIWLFLLYLLNCWSVCNQTCTDSKTSEAGVSCAKNGLLRSRSRSQQRVKCWWMFVRMLFSEPQIILILNLVW